MLKPIAALGGTMVVVGVIGFIAVGLKGNSIFTTSSTRVDQVKQLDGRGVTDIQVSTDATAIHLLPTNQNKITVHLYGYFSKKDDFFSVVRDGQAVRVDFRRNRHVQLFNWFQVHNESITVDVSVPRNQYEQISLKTNAGSVSAGHISSHEWDLRTNAGAIRTESLSGDVTASTNAGLIQASNSIGALTLETNAGQIEVKQRQITHNITARTNAGEISISTQEVPKNLQLHLTTDVGNVSMNLPNANVSDSAHDHWEGSIGGGGPTVDARTDVGAITVDQE